MIKDPWHYSRTKLAQQVLNMFITNMSSALVFFAPRRMGKTEFLQKDVTPLAKKSGWKVFYFSFLDVEKNAALFFGGALESFAREIGTINNHSFRKNISKISGEIIGVKAELELRDPKRLHSDIKEIMDSLASKEKVLLLLDEIQVLAQDIKNDSLIATLRTTLDIHKDNLKVIFTGSSQDGLRRMFSQTKAPFFHFGQNLPFPELEQGFTDHLVEVFYSVTRRKLDADALWEAFLKMQKIPQLARILVERLALHPSLHIEEAQKQLMAEIFNASAFVNIWEKCSTIEQLLLLEIANNSVCSLFGNDTRKRFAKKIGIQDLPVSSIQSTLRVLQRKKLIGRLLERSSYFIDDLNFKNWLNAQEFVKS